MNVIPKLVLISWTFSILHWYGWIFMTVLFLIAGQQIHCAVPEKTLKSKLLLTIQITFGYVGGYRGPMISALLLTCFQVPLGIALHAAMNSSYMQDYDSFAIFPPNPFPSRTICFTYFSKIKQEQRWINRTDQLSESCNFTFSAVPCYEEERTYILKWLISMITIISVGPLLMIVWICRNISKEKKLEEAKREEIEMGYY